MIFTQLPTEILHVIYKKAVKLRHEQKMIWLCTYSAIRDVASSLDRTTQIEHETFKKYSITSSGVIDKIEMIDDDEYTYAILRRVVTIHAHIDIVIEYRRCHAYKLKSKRYAANRKLKYVDTVKIYRVDQKSSQTLEKMSESIKYDNTLDIRARDVRAMMS